MGFGLEVPSFMNPKLPARLYLFFLCVSVSAGEERLTPPVDVEGQPLAANVKRVLEALEFLGAPLPAESTKALRAAAEALDPRKLQELLDPRVLFLVRLDSGKVTVERGPAQAVLQQAGFTPVLLKVLNPASGRKRLRAVSPQSGPVYAGASDLSLRREEQLSLGENQNIKGEPGRFLTLEIYTSPPLSAELSGLQVEYAVLLIHSVEAGEREARVGFEVDGAGGEPGPRGEAPLRFEARPAVKVKLRILDFDGKPAAARLVFRGPAGQVYPPQPKRLAPDLFFQTQVYRNDGDTVLLPPGDLRLEYTRGPEYRALQKSVTITAGSEASFEIKLERWINPVDFGFYGGDHHIHAAGCAHYTSPTEGITPADMLLQVRGEGLNVGCVLTWGPCFEFQRRYFSPAADRLSDPFTVLKYDLEISGFGSQALGHVCLLGLKDQTYPGSDGTKTRGWPTWTTPVLRWAKAQGGFTGYAHSASGLAIEPRSAAKRLLDRLDSGKDGFLGAQEAERGLLPEDFSAIDADGDGLLSEAELVQSHERAAEELPNLAIPEMNGVGAMEIPVSAAMGTCDFISAMNTARIQEWNTWYHLLDCGLPVKVSGETDFPCMSGTRIGQGRVYVRLGKVDRIEFQAWCEGLARGRSYVSDGYGHALEFTVQGHRPGEGAVRLDRAGSVIVKAKVAFSRETPLSVAQGGIVPREGKELVGDTVLLHGSPLEGPSSGERYQGGKRSVEVVLNSIPIARAEVPADGEVHDLSFEVPVERSAWIALRQFPGLHTNPVEVLVAGKPIRASRKSALWLIDVIDLLWQNREAAIAGGERDEARRTFQEAKEMYRRIASESPGISR